VRNTRLESCASASGDNLVVKSRCGLAPRKNPRLRLQTLQADPLQVRQTMFCRQDRYQRFKPNRLDVDGTVHGPRGMQKAEVELPRADCFKSFIAVKIIEQHLYVRIGTPKTVGGNGNDAKGGGANKTQPDASDLASARAPRGMRSIGSAFKDSANTLQKCQAGRSERNRSLCPYEKLDTDFAFEPTNFLAQVGLCNMEPRRCAREMKLLGDRDKEFQLSMFHGSLILITS